MSLDPRVELERLATVAHDQGRVKVEAVCRLALARLEALEAELQQIRARHALAGKARADALTPEQRSASARTAANTRWLRRRAS